MRRLLSWFIFWLGPRTLLSLMLLLVALGSVALGLAEVIRGPDAGLLLTVTGLGLLLGWGLGKSPLPGWFGSLVALGLGAEVAMLRVGRLGGTLLGLLGTLARLGWETWRWPLDGAPDGAPALLLLEDLWSGVSTLLVRLYHWSLALASGESAFDPVAVALVWSLALWGMGAWAGWFVRRRAQPLYGMAPAGALLGISLFYVRGSPVVLLPLLGATLLLIALIAYQARERRWGMEGIDFHLDVGQDLAMAVIPLSLALVAIAALTPSISVQQVAQWAGRLFQGQAREAEPVADSLGLDPYSRLDPGSKATTLFDQDQVRAPGLPRRHLIGSGPELSERVVMVIYPERDIVSDNSGPPQVVSEKVAPRYYWRGLTYDQYTGRGWITGGTETLEYQAGDLAIFRDASDLPGGDSQTIFAATLGRQRLRQEVWALGSLGELIHTAGDLVTADQDYRVAWRSGDDIFGAALISTARSTGRGDAGRQVTVANPIVYRADSLVPVVGEAQLRAAGSDYPGWVRDRYLALPDEMPTRVLALARDLTATAPTPYDRARAIETYLRDFPYNLDLPAPPSGRDVVDYFLFDLQQGYCDYYATSMVVLARAAGLPARLVVGYASGTYDEANARYIVTEADAHSWIEIYFPGYGWVEFEPTAGLPPIERPADAVPLVPFELERSDPLVARPLQGGRLWWLGLLGGAPLLLVVVAIVWSLADGWRLRRLRPAAALAILYRRLRRHGRRLAVSARDGDTPYEFATSMAERVTALAQQKRWRRVLAPAVQEVRWLVDLYVRGLYSPHRPDTADQVRAIKTWQRLRRRLWLAWVPRK